MDWRFWRRFRRTASHASAEDIPASVMRAEKRASRFSIAETCFGILVVAGVLYEDWDNLPMIVHPNSPAGRMAIGGIIVAFGIVAEIWCSSRSSKAEYEIRDWYAERVAELNLIAEQERLARVKIEENLLAIKSPRTLTAEQQARVANSVKSFPETLFDLATTLRDEPMALAEQIENSLISAGWRNVDWESLVHIARTGKTKLGLAADTGVSVQIEKAQEPYLLMSAKALAAALTDEGIAARMEFMDTPQTRNHTAIHIIVGDKPS